MWRTGLPDRKSVLLAALHRAAIACIAVLCIGHARAQEWQVLDLGQHVTAVALNNLGQVAGNTVTPDGIAQAFVTGPDAAGMRLLSTSRFASSQAAGINDAGQVVGLITDLREPRLPFITGPNGSGLRVLPTPGGTEVHLTDINNAGQVAGYWISASSHQLRGFITGPNGGPIVELGTLGGGTFAHALNDSGQVTGFSYDSNADQRVFLTGPGGVGMTDLGSLGGPHSMGFDVNDAGQVVGRSYLPGYLGSHAFLTGPDGLGMKDLGAPGLPGSSISFSEAYAVNNAAQVVGYDYYGGSVRAFVTGPEGSDKVDLNTLVDLPEGDWLEVASDINDRGQVIAWSHLQRSYLLTPVPEPSSALFMLTGLLLLGRLRGACRRQDQRPAQAGA